MDDDPWVDRRRETDKRALPAIGAAAFIMLFLAGIATVILWDWKWLIFWTGSVSRAGFLGCIPGGTR